MKFTHNTNGLPQPILIGTTTRRRNLMKRDQSEREI